ncbi:MAG: hypothetical protein E7607_06150 [Ruminococcaceae bacterium]|nr:hypothetical protein [Oscillospiraceae bacterium]
MKKIKIFALILTLFMLLPLTVHAESDYTPSDYEPNYEGESNGDGIGDITVEAADGEEDTAESSARGHKIALTFIFSALGLIAAGGTAAFVYVVVKNKRDRQN